MSAQPMRHAFVRAVPETLEPETLYVSLDYVTTSHLCACGCGAEVVLPLHPTKWRMTFDGASVSMDPSIGSRTLPCRSHYWIDKGRVRWANRMSDEDFERALERDQRTDKAWHGRDALRALPTDQTMNNPAQASAPIPIYPAGDAGLFAHARAILKRLFRS